MLLELPEVAEAAAVGVADERSGQVVRAVLVLAAGAELTVEQVREHCAERLARFKVPGSVEFVPALPRTATGKVARRQLATRPEVGAELEDKLRWRVVLGRRAGNVSGE